MRAFVAGATLTAALLAVGCGGGSMVFLDQGDFADKNMSVNLWKAEAISAYSVAKGLEDAGYPVASKEREGGLIRSKPVLRDGRRVRAYVVLENHPSRKNTFMARLRFVEVDKGFDLSHTRWSKSWARSEARRIFDVVEKVHEATKIPPAGFAW